MSATAIDAIGCAVSPWPVGTLKTSRSPYIRSAEIAVQLTLVILTLLWILPEPTRHA
ncbi:hypothetical protein [Paraburkholderia sp.]|uniref:hypothetical protein n=1 Tax=Paraburkholderia sp. TaxID=1926495 RepID=UPI002F40E90F